MKEINIKFANKIPIIPVIGNNKFFIVDMLYSLGMHEICFNFKPNFVLNTINGVIEKKEPENVCSEDYYLIDFYENKGTFIIDISGFLKKDKISPLKLMFENYLRFKIKELRCVIYIFSNISEDSISFSNVWTLLRIWKEIGVKYNKIGFLSSSDILTHKVIQYFDSYGMKKFENLLEAIKNYYPELAAKNEMELFEFSASLLQSPNKLPTQGR